MRVLFIVLALHGGIGSGAELEKFSFEREAMGTRFSVVAYGENRDTVKKAAYKAFEICEVSRCSHAVLLVRRREQPHWLHSMP